MPACKLKPELFHLGMFGGWGVEGHESCHPLFLMRETLRKVHQLDHALGRQDPGPVLPYSKKKELPQTNLSLK